MKDVSRTKTLEEKVTNMSQVLKPAKGRVRQDVTCPIRDGIIYASIWVERSHVTCVSPLWQNHDVIFL